MNNNVTKILIIIAIILIFSLSAIGIYRYSSTTTTQNPTTSEPEPVFPKSQDIEITPSNSANKRTGDVTIPNQQVPKLQTPGIISDQPVTNITSANVKIISTKPVSGSFFTEKQEVGSKEPKLYIRYSERESGHIYEIAYNENIPKKLSNTTITRVYETYFNTLGDNILYRRLDENNNIQNIYAKLETLPISTSTEEILSSNVGKLNQTLLQSDIKEVAISPNKDKIFYLTAIGDNYIGTIENFGGKASGKKQVFSSPLSEWLVQWPKDNTLYFNTKASVTVPGYLFAVNIDKQDFTKVLGDIKGLTSKVSPNLKKMVYSESADGWVNTYIYDLGTKKSSVLPLKTLPEKCVWGGVDKDLLYCATPIQPVNNDYPDAWYQGIESFDDEIWLINTTTGQTNLLVDQETLNKNEGIDAIDLQLSPKEDYLSLVNKKDQSLWLIKIK